MAWQPPPRPAMVPVAVPEPEISAPIEPETTPEPVAEVMPEWIPEPDRPAAQGIYSTGWRMARSRSLRCSRARSGSESTSRRCGRRNLLCASARRKGRTAGGGRCRQKAGDFSCPYKVLPSALARPRFRPAGARPPVQPLMGRASSRGLLGAPCRVGRAGLSRKDAVDYPSGQKRPIRERAFFIILLGCDRQFSTKSPLTRTIV